MAITQEFKTRWLNGLRAGRYEQGRLNLEENGKYCCLGVACAVMAFRLRFVMKMEVISSLYKTGWTRRRNKFCGF